MLRLLSRVYPSVQTQINLKLAQSLCSACPDFAVKPIMEPKLYQPPAEVRGMTSLDKEAFAQTITVPALRVPTGVLNKVVKSLKKSTIQRPGVPRVVQDQEESSDVRLVLLDPHRVSSPKSFSEAEAEALRSFGVAEELQDYELSLTYDNLKTEEVLQAVLPQGQDVTSGFSRVGHIAHMNLRDHQLPYRNLIANDLNPESYKWLQHNCKLNKVESKVRTFNLDGRAFIQGPMKQELPTLLKGKASVHVVMNLPALALEFLDAFRGLLHQEPPCDDNLPTVHCYGFSKDDNPDKDVVERASRSLGFPLENRCSVHFVRNVAPNKDMMCVSFTLPKEILFSSEHEQTGEGVKAERPQDHATIRASSPWTLN
eukprot:superscaffoldBa00000900_g7898